MTSPSGGCSACAIAEAASATATTSKPSSPSPRDSTKRSSGSSSTTSSRNTVTWTPVWLPGPDSHLNGRRSGAVQGRRASVASMTTTAAQTRDAATLGRKMLNKVPEVTLFFWVIKIMCTTVGETAADYLNDEPRLRADEHDVRHRRTARRAAARPVPAAPLRARRLLVGRRGHQRVRHADHRQPDRPLQRAADDEHARSSRSILAVVFAGLVRHRAHALDPHDLHDAPRGLLLAGDPLHLRAGHRRGRPLGREARPRLRRLDRSSSAALIAADHRRALRASGSTRSCRSGWRTSSPGRSARRSATTCRRTASKYGGLGLGTTGTSYIFLGCILALVAFLSITRKDATETRRATPLPESA